jgi:hypothetical protein
MASRQAEIASRTSPRRRYAVAHVVMHRGRVGLVFRGLPVGVECVCRVAPVQQYVAAIEVGARQFGLELNCCSCSVSGPLPVAPALPARCPLQGRRSAVALRPARRASAGGVGGCGRGLSTKRSNKPICLPILADVVPECLSCTRCATCRARRPRNARAKRGASKTGEAKDLLSQILRSAARACSRRHAIPREQHSREHQWRPTRANRRSSAGRRPGATKSARPPASTPEHPSTRLPTRGGAPGKGNGSRAISTRW